MQPPPWVKTKCEIRNQVKGHIVFLDTAVTDRTENLLAAVYHRITSMKHAVFNWKHDKYMRHAGDCGCLLVSHTRNNCAGSTLHQDFFENQFENYHQQRALGKDMMSHSRK